jgi:predicted ATPase
MLDSEEIEYNPVQSFLVEELSQLQKAIENYESIWKILRKKFNRNLSDSITQTQTLPPVSTSVPSNSNSVLKSFFVGFSKNEKLNSIEKSNTSKDLFNQESNLKLIDEILSHKPAGLYVWGGPGCGKTFLLDKTFDMIDTKYKKRLHFNEFMLRIHHTNHKYSQVRLLIKPFDN